MKETKKPVVILLCALLLAGCGAGNQILDSAKVSFSSVISSWSGTPTVASDEFTLAMRMNKVQNFTVRVSETGKEYGSLEETSSSSSVSGSASSSASASSEGSEASSEAVSEKDATPFSINSITVFDTKKGYQLMEAIFGQEHVYSESYFIVSGTYLYKAVRNDLSADWSLGPKGSGAIYTRAIDMLDDTYKTLSSYYYGSGTTKPMIFTKLKYDALTYDDKNSVYDFGTFTQNSTGLHINETVNSGYLRFNDTKLVQTYVDFSSVFTKTNAVETGTELSTFYDYGNSAVTIPAEVQPLLDSLMATSSSSSAA